MSERDTDFELLLAWRAGDRGAGGRLIARHSGTLLRFFQTKVGEDAEDLVQQTFVACTEKKGSIRELGSFKAYLLAIARTLLIEHLRRRARRDRRFDVLETSAADIVASPSQRVAEDEVHRMTVEALRRIPLDFQIALELFYWEDMAGPELAQALGLPEGTVRTRLRRGRQLLRERLRELGAPDGAALG